MAVHRDGSCAVERDPLEGDVSHEHRETLAGLDVPEPDGLVERSRERSRAVECRFIKSLGESKLTLESTERRLEEWISTVNLRPASEVAITTLRESARRSGGLDSPEDSTTFAGSRVTARSA